MITRLCTLLLALALVGTACGDDDDAAEPADTTTTAPADATTTAAPVDETTTSPPVDETTTVPADTADLQLADSDLGPILVDDAGNVLYLFQPDAQGESTCYDACEANWPVLEEVASVGDGLDPAALGTTTRTDGVVQATYNGWPLYYFAADAAPGDTNGQGVNDVWWVVDANGDAVGAA